MQRNGLKANHVSPTRDSTRNSCGPTIILVNHFTRTPYTFSNSAGQEAGFINLELLELLDRTPLLYDLEYSLPI